MAYPGQKSQFYVIGQNKTCLPNPSVKVFNKIVVGGVAGDLTLKGFGILTEVAANGADCSAVNNPVSSGILEAGSILTSSVVSGVDEETTFTADTSGTVTVTRNGQTITLTDTPSFNNIAVTAGVLASIDVNNDGDDLEFGDVITFPLTTNIGASISITLDQDDIQLAAGWYSYKSESHEYIVPVVAGEVIEGSFSSIKTPNTASFACKAYV